MESLRGYLNACGHFRTGILTAPLTGVVIADMAAGVRPSHPVEAYLLSRFDEGQVPKEATLRASESGQT